MQSVNGQAIGGLVQFAYCKPQELSIVTKPSESAGREVADDLKLC